MPLRLMLATLLFLAAAGAARAQEDDPIMAQPSLPKQKLTIQGHGTAPHVFDAEIATTPRQQQVGEMYRTAIPADGGMFFDWGAPREVPMWMKHCPVPEDMVFIGADGTITHIAENTVPNSLALISSFGLVRATLELQGGITEKFDIRVGDKIKGGIFSK